MDDLLYMMRCIGLARLGKGRTSPNPMVGAVLVAKGRIIGEGYHEQYGKAHAEVNCIASVQPADLPLISQATLFVSLEPCSHFGKTPPCTSLIIEKKIPKVVIGCPDPFPAVNGKGIAILRKEGVEVTVGILEEACRELNRYFFHYQQFHRPYIILKWAQSADGMIAGNSSNRTYITNAYTNRIVHQWRSEVMGIMVGSNTVLMDDPELTTRYWPGKNPARIIIDPDNKAGSSLLALNEKAPTLVFSRNRQEAVGNVNYVSLGDGDLARKVISTLYNMNFQSVMIEGGARLLQSFIDEGLWDEARVITNEKLQIGDGLSAPVLTHHEEKSADTILTDTVRFYIKN